jgi:aldehyde dehydrogenase (NAD+)
MQLRDKIYINGTWVAPQGKGTIDVHNSATEEVMARIPECSAADVNTAVAAARAAFDSWAAIPPAKRAEYLQKIHEGMKARSSAKRSPKKWACR